MKFIKSIAVAGALAVTSAYAQPSIEFTVTHAPGGPSDTVTRIVAKHMERHSLPVVNRPGAGGRIAMKQVVAGNAMSLATMSQIFVTNDLMVENLEYNVNRDLQLIGVVAAMPNALVCNKSKNINTVADLSKVSGLTFGVAGYGSSEHLATEVLIKKTKSSHRVIPYSKGGSAAVQDMMAGNIDCMFANFPTVRGVTASDKLHFVMSSHELDLGVPTWKKVFGEEFPFQSYLGLVVGTKMDANEKQLLINDLTATFQKPAFIEELKKSGVFPVAGTDSKTISMGLYNNVLLRNFILNNNIKTN